MEINSKQFLIVAAVGAAAWYMLRKSSGGVIAAAKPAPAPAGGAASIWDGFGVSDFSGMAQAIMGAGGSAPASGGAGSTTPAPRTGGVYPFPAQEPQAPRTGGVYPYPAQAPQAQQAQAAVWGGTTQGAAAPATSTVNESGLRTYSDGSTYQMTEGDLYVYNLQKSGKFVYP